ncbi:MAG: hypothetical protein MMC33_007569 [Icmadophila ericetorum]|nr:hypothetical protein [Icmadophila ericetorum]
MAAIPPTSSSHSSHSSPRSSLATFTSAHAVQPCLPVPSIDADHAEIQNYIISFLINVYAYSPSMAETEAQKCLGNGEVFYRLNEADLKVLFGSAGMLMWDEVQSSKYGLLCLTQSAAKLCQSHVWAYTGVISGNVTAVCAGGATVASIYGDEAQPLVSIGTGFGVNLLIFAAHRRCFSQRYIQGKIWEPTKARHGGTPLSQRGWRWGSK